MKKLNGIDARTRIDGDSDIAHDRSIAARPFALPDGRSTGQTARYLGHFSITHRRRATDADVVLAFLLRSSPLTFS